MGKPCASTPTMLQLTLARAILYITSSGLRRRWPLMSKPCALTPTMHWPTTTKATPLNVSGGNERHSKHTKEQESLATRGRRGKDWRWKWKGRDDFVGVTGVWGREDPSLRSG